MTLQGVFNWKICKGCKQPFDIETNFDTCPICRINQMISKKRFGDGRRN